MSQLIIDSLIQRLEDEIPISALLAVSPGFKRALTPWFITKSGTTVRNEDEECPREFLSLKTIKFLYSVSPSTFQFATALSIKVKNEQELTEVISSDAAKSLFRQAHTLRLKSPAVYNPENLVQFIQQFGLLETCRLCFDQKTQNASRSHQNETADFFCQVLSSTAITRNYSLSFSLVDSLDDWCIMAGGRARIDQDGRILSVLVDLMLLCFKTDNGSSSLLFLDCFRRILVEWRSICDTSKFDILVPLLDFWDGIVRTSGEFKRVIKKTEYGRTEYRTASEILYILDWILYQSDHQVVFNFVQRYGQSLLRNVSKIVFDRDLKQQKQTGDLRGDEFDQMFGTFRFLIVKRWNSSNDAESSSASTSSSLGAEPRSLNLDALCADLFPFDVLCQFIVHADYSSASHVCAVFSSLRQAIRKPNSVLKSHHQQSLCDVTGKLFQYLSRLEFHRWGVMEERDYDDILKPLVRGLFKMLFGFDEDDRNDIFHQQIRSSLFNVNSTMADAVLKLGRVIAVELDREYDQFGSFPGMIQHDMFAFHRYVSFVKQYALSLLQSILTFSVENTTISNTNSNNQKKSQTVVMNQENEKKISFKKELRATVADIKRFYKRYADTSK